VLYVLELWHGPTFAFKDVALQLLGNLFEFFLIRRNERLRAEKERNGEVLKEEDKDKLTVVGATSGDTGRLVWPFCNRRDKLTEKILRTVLLSTGYEIKRISLYSFYTPKAVFHPYKKPR